MAGVDKIAIHNLFGIEGLDVAWYGIIIASGIVLGVVVAVFQARAKGYTSEIIFDMMIAALPLSIIGARIYYVAFEWEYFSQHPEQIIAVWNGGIAIIGAIIGAVFGAWLVARINKFPFGRLLDFGAPGLILGQAIGRWGNFINQEAFGTAVTDPSMQFFPFAVYVEDVYAGTEHFSGWYHATFFYESMWNLGIFVLLLWFAKRNKYDGNVFALYLVGYGAGRLWIEGMRVQTLQLWPGMPVSQFLSAIFIALGVAWLLYTHFKKPANKVYEGKYLMGWEDEGQGKKDKPKKV